jgi:hypothetical protein
MLRPPVLVWRGLPRRAAWFVRAALAEFAPDDILWPVRKSAAGSRCTCSAKNLAQRLMLATLQRSAMASEARIPRRRRTPGIIGRARKSSNASTSAAGVAASSVQRPRHIHNVAEQGMETTFGARGLGTSQGDKVSTVRHSCVACGVDDGRSRWTSDYCSGASLIASVTADKGPGASR